MDRATLKSMAKSQIKGNIGTLFVISLLIYLITGALNCIPGVGSLASVLIAPAFSLALIVVYLEMTDGIKPEIGAMFSQIKNFWPAFKVNFLMSLYIMLWSLLLYIPGIVKACAYSQAMYILAEDPTLGANEAITRSRKMMDGHKMEYFVLGLSFLGWIILGMFTFGILYIWLIPYMQATMANYYKSLKANAVVE